MVGLGLGLVLVGAAGCSGSDTDGATRYCDVVKQVQAGVDPLADQSIYADPAGLKDALIVRVKTYTDLAARAPDEVKADAATLRDGVIRVNNALSAADYRSAAANTDPAVQAVLGDAAFQAAAARLAGYNADYCSD